LSASRDGPLKDVDRRHCNSAALDDLSWTRRLLGPNALSGLSS
jgi:hypothetical protein